MPGRTRGRISPTWPRSTGLAAVLRQVWVFELHYSDAI
jgi:hypothetical protein